MATDEFLLAVGGTVQVGDHEFTLVPQDVSNIEIGTFRIELPEDESRAIGSLAQFYADVDGLLDDELPDLPEVGGALGRLLTAQLTLQAFELKVVKGAVARLHIDVSVAAEWPVPNTRLSIERLRFVLTYAPTAS